MPSTRRLSTALLIIRLSAAAFLAVWTSLKFYRPEWMANVYKGAVPLDFEGLNIALIAGIVQTILVALFALGAFRTPVYALVTIMHATGVMTVALSGRLWDWTAFPNNLLWTSVATLGALAALFILRHHDGFSIDGMRRRTSS